MLAEPLLTVREAAELLNISSRTLYAHVETNRIPCLRIGRAVRFDREALIEFLARAVP